MVKPMARTGKSSMYGSVCDIAGFAPSATIWPQLACGGTDADADKAQRRFGEDGGRDAEGQGDDDRRQAVGQHVLRMMYLPLRRPPPAPR